MKAARFDYAKPATMAEALGALRDTRGATKIAGGTQSLGPMLNLRLARPAALVDVSQLPELRTVTTEGNDIRIGAAITHAQIEDGVFPELRGGLLQHVAPGIAYRAIRTRGTVGGSLAHADPAADWVLTMTALAARLELRSASGTRTVAMDDFMRGAYTTVLEADEVIAAISVPRMGARARWGYYKICRKPGEFAEASCAAAFDPDAGLARVVVGALDGAPRALPEVASVVARTGALPAAALVEKEIAAAAASRDAVDRQLLCVSVQRCLEQVLGQRALQ